MFVYSFFIYSEYYFEEYLFKIAAREIASHKPEKIVFDRASRESVDGQKKIETLYILYRMEMLKNQGGIHRFKRIGFFKGVGIFLATVILSNLFWQWFYSFTS